MEDYLEEIDVNITSYLNNSKNSSIKRILDVLDMSDISEPHKKKLRQIVLDELNEFHTSCCRALTCIQEKQNGQDSNEQNKFG